MKDKFHLYKYFNIVGSLKPRLKRIDIVKEILIKEQIYIPSLEMLNDPFEEIINSQKDKKEIIPSNKGVLSFTTNYNNLLMWSHYSGSHSGLAIKFLIDKDHIKNYKKVQYIKEKEELNILNKILVKSSEWSYENEYRLVLNENSKQINLSDIGLSIDGIIFGFKCPEQTRKTLQEICLAKDLKWGQISLKSDFSCNIHGYSKDESVVLQDIIHPPPPDYDFEPSEDYFEDLQRQYEYEQSLEEEARESNEFQKFLKKKEKLQKKYKIEI